jgi:xylulose-5-phosphate/fructose-6-phosphate phosphoketolase
VFAFHGYPSAVQSLIFPRGSGVGQSRFNILGYIEQGSKVASSSRRDRID